MMRSIYSFVDGIRQIHKSVSPTPWQTSMTVQPLAVELDRDSDYPRVNIDFIHGPEANVDDIDRSALPFCE